MSTKRIPISKDAIEEVVKDFRAKLKAAFQKHGPGACWSTHEALGLIEEERNELATESHKGRIKHFRNEGIDVMIAGFYAAVSVDVGGIKKRWDGRKNKKPR